MPAFTASLKLAAVAYVLLFGGLGVYLAPLQPSVVALQLTFTPEAFARVLHAWGPEGVQRFRQHLPVDGLLLLSYGAAGYLAVVRTRFFEPLAKRLPLRRVALLLPLVALCDAGGEPAALAADGKRCLVVSVGICMVPSRGPVRITQMGWHRGVCAGSTDGTFAAPSRLSSKPRRWTTSHSLQSLAAHDQFPKIGCTNVPAPEHRF